MKAIILYPVFVVGGLFIAVSVGLFVEREWSSGVSVLVFIALFFASFYVAWMLTKFIVERAIARNSSGSAS